MSNHRQSSNTCSTYLTNKAQSRFFSAQNPPRPPKVRPWPGSRPRGSQRPCGCSNRLERKSPQLAARCMSGQHNAGSPYPVTPLERNAEGPRFVNAWSCSWLAAQKQLENVLASEGAVHPPPPGRGNQGLPVRFHRSWGFEPPKRPSEHAKLSAKPRYSPSRSPRWWP